MPKSQPQVFLDANIVIRAGKPPGGPEIERVGDLVDAGLIRVLTTDLTVTEVSKKHSANDFEVIREVGRPHFRRIVEDVLGAKLPAVTKSDIKAALDKQYSDSTSAMFKSLKAKVLEIDDVKPSAVFASYAAGSGFFSGEGKKDQFPDAFTFECLKAVATKTSPVIIISDDGDFDAPAKQEDNITVLKSLPDLFKHLGFEMAAPPVEEFLEENTDELAKLVNNEVEDWGLIGDVEDSEVYDVAVDEVEIEKVAAFKPVEEGDSVLAIATLRVSARASFTHPDWDSASYDSEDKVLIPWDDVSGETDLQFSVDVSMSIAVDEDGNPAELDTLSFRNSNFQYVTLHPFEDYK
ncbi:PIN domain-containing protein [Pararhodobacter sp.]|uniref:PIN domain-containing protein n=1 Tax=Pararhodobacter sp. TaxID=2127056 RepID=UPI002AFE2BA1|nr:PIN domain-containing protein [Pararhodobacter sp.]